jgi:glutamyl-tRNA synthetase
LTVNPDYTDKVIALVKDRCTFLTDFWQESKFFFETPAQYDLPSVQPKWNDKKQQFFVEIIRQFELMPFWNAADLEKEFKEMMAVHELKPGDVLLPLRVMLVGGKSGPAVFDIAATLGKHETIDRIKRMMQLLQLQK